MDFLISERTMCSTQMHTPSWTPREDQLTLVKLLHLVINHVLTFMFDLQYKRQGRIKQTTNKLKTLFLYTYIPQESKDFTRFKLDHSHEKGKPIIPAWALVGPGDLNESEILAVGGGLVQPASSLINRQTNHCKLKYLPGIEEDHIRPLKIQKNQ